MFPLIFLAALPSFCISFHAPRPLQFFFLHFGSAFGHCSSFTFSSCFLGFFAPIYVFYGTLFSCFACSLKILVSRTLWYNLNYSFMILEKAPHITLLLFRGALVSHFVAQMYWFVSSLLYRFLVLIFKLWFLAFLEAFVSRISSCPAMKFACIKRLIIWMHLLLYLFTHHWPGLPASFRPLSYCQNVPVYLKWFVPVLYLCGRFLLCHTFVSVSCKICWLLLFATFLHYSFHTVIRLFFYSWHIGTPFSLRIKIWHFVHFLFVALVCVPLQQLFPILYFIACNNSLFK